MKPSNIISIAGSVVKSAFSTSKIIIGLNLLSLPETERTPVYYLFKFTKNFNN